MKAVICRDTELKVEELPEVEPAKGQLLAVRATPVRHVISWNDHYVVPRRNGETILGSNVEFVGYNKDVIMETLNTLLERSDDLVPGIARAPLSRFWAGLRPYSPTRRPLLCRAPGLDNVVLATGHHRNGIVLAPITGTLIADLITSGQSAVELAPFGLPPAHDAVRGSSAPSDQTEDQTD